MIQLHTDGVLAYDSRLEDYDLLTLSTTAGLNKGGTATITMPHGHPSYNSFVPYKTIVELRRDGRLLFRGRPAGKPADDFYNNRTVTCEGELCFLLDAVVRPYLYQASPAEIFADLVSLYNAQVEEVKRFRLGSVTVVDQNDYIRVESEEAESVQAVVNKLLERCGGYIVFTTDATNGARVINWLAELPYRSEQTIEFGENLLDFSRAGGNTTLATAVLPYGAKNEETGVRVTIEDVNDGVDYIQDDEAVALRGFIIVPVIWEDVTVPANLLRKAQEWLAVNKQIITTLSLSAEDLSRYDKSIDSFQVGDKIRVRSKPHQVDEDFLLTEMAEDHLHAGNGSITMGKDKSSLTGADVAGDRQSRSELQKVTRDLKAEYTANIAQAIQTTEEKLQSLIQQTSEAIKLEVSEEYTTNDRLTSALSTSMTVLSDEILFEFDILRQTLEGADAELRAGYDEIRRYISFAGGVITLGTSENSITLTIENDLIIFKKAGVQFGWWDGVDFHTGNIVVEVNERAQFGSFAFVPRSNGSLSFLKVRG